jgi:hypothetical protein
MSENTRNCCISNVYVSTFTLIGVPAVASNASQLTSQTQQNAQWYYVSTIQAANQVTNPNYQYQYKSQTERLAAKLGRLTLNGCNN